MADEPAKEPGLLSEIGEMFGLLKRIAERKASEAAAEKSAANVRANLNRLHSTEAYKLMPSLVANKEIGALYEKFSDASMARSRYVEAEREIFRMVKTSQIEIEKPSGLAVDPVLEKRLAKLGEDNALSVALNKRISELTPAEDHAYEAINVAVAKEIKEAQRKTPAIETDEWTLKGMAMEYRKAKREQKAILDEGKSLPPYDEDNEVYGLVIDDPEKHEKAKAEGNLMLKLKYSPAGEEREKIYQKYRNLEAATGLYMAETIDKAAPEKVGAMTELFMKISQNPYDDREKVVRTREAIQYAQNAEALKSDSFIQQKMIPGLSMYASELQAHHEKYFPAQQRNTPQPEIPGEQASPQTPADSLPTKVKGKN